LNAYHALRFKPLKSRIFEQSCCFRERKLHLICKAFIVNFSLNSMAEKENLTTGIGKNQVFFRMLFFFPE
jgi:hypothetical protein